MHQGDRFVKTKFVACKATALTRRSFLCLDLGSISVEPNRQIDGNEKLHKNHLHITARDPYLQP